LWSLYAPHSRYRVLTAAVWCRASFLVRAEIHVHIHFSPRSYT
jgi:hypothetical protein